VSVRTSSGGVSSSSAIFTAALVLQRGLPFFALPIVARAVAQETFGIIAVVTTVAAVGAVVLSLGLQSAVPRLIYDDGLEGASTAWSAMVRVQLAFAVGALALALIALGLIDVSGLADVSIYVYLTPVLAAALSVHYLFQGIAVARGAAARSFVASCVQVVVGAGAGPWLAFRFGGPAFVAALAAASLLATTVLSRPRLPPPQWDAQRIRAGLGLAIPFVWQGLSTWLLSLSDRIILALYFSAGTVGVYQVSYMVGNAVGLVLEGVQSAWAPRYYRSTRTDKRKILLDLVQWFVVTSACAALVVVAVSPLVLGVIAPDYRIDLVVLGIVALAAVPRGMYFVLVADLLERKQTRSIAVSTACGAALAVGVDLFLLPFTGLWMAAAATVLAFAVQAAIVARRALGTWWRRQYLRWTVVPLAATAALMSLCLVVEHRARPGEQAVTVVVLVVLLLTSGGILFRRLRHATDLWGTGGGRDGS
jgi:O-antigen/teichoic acid export membrane protein